MKEWRDSSACAGTEAALFFPAGTGESDQPRIAAAKEVCGACPVAQPCLSYALRVESETGLRYGIFGGLTALERRRLVEAGAA